MGGAASPPPRWPGEAAGVTELELRIQLLGGAGGVCYHINDNADLLAEILARLDGRSLAAAAGVCRLWAAVARRDAVWEALCLRHVGGPATPSASAGPATRAVVAALGGYRRLYRLCLGPALDRLGRAGALAQAQAARAHHLSLSLSLSLFSIDCYERLGGGGGRGGSSRRRRRCCSSASPSTCRDGIHHRPGRHVLCCCCCCLCPVCPTSSRPWFKLPSSHLLSECSTDAAAA